MNEPTPQRDKRRSRRRLPKGRVKAYLRLSGLDMGQNVCLSLIDLSETGACMVVKEAVQTGREVTAGLEGQSHSRPVKCVGIVAWCKPAEGGAFTVGVTFQKHLPYSVYLDLTQEPRGYPTAPAHAPEKPDES